MVDSAYGCVRDEPPAHQDHPVGPTHSGLAVPSVGTMYRPCIDCGVPSRGTRCRQHQLLWDAVDAHVQGWATIALAYLADHRVCTCGARATEVDHRVPLRDGGTHLDSNLQAMCSSCHRRKTHSETVRRALASLD